MTKTINGGTIQRRVSAKRARPAVIRMADVARQAGVSIMTVSRALNEPEKVSIDMKRRVEAAVDKIGYVPNQLARNLSSSRSNVIGLIVPSIDNSLFTETMKGISDVLRANACQLMIADSGHSLADEEALIGAFVSQRVAGLVLHNTSHTSRAVDMIRQAGIPIIENGNLTPHPIDSVVSYSSFEASRAMTLHLCRLGYQSVALVSLPAAENDRARERRRGYLAALAEIGRPVDRRLIMERPPGLAAGAEAITRLLNGAAPVDAVFFAGDVLAIGAVLECRRRGWDVPGRVGIASFDDLDLLRHMTPTITTVRLPRYEIGRRAAECLLERIGGSVGPGVRIDLKFEILQREST